MEHSLCDILIHIPPGAHLSSIQWLFSHSLLRVYGASSHAASRPYVTHIPIFVPSVVLASGTQQGIARF